MQEYEVEKEFNDEEGETILVIENSSLKMKIIIKI